ncbi:MAG: hypothetical protein HY619_08125 [Thaumarchaeota archaeon]|nr:hypothetical protein [Nitrososphaerota archaeon]
MRITIVNNDTINHNWGVDVLSPAAFNVRTPTIRGVGNTTSVEFVAGIPGVKYYCNVGRHRQLGLEGNLVVNAIAPPPPDVSSRVKTFEDQVNTLLSLANQVRDLDGQVKSISSSVTNQVKGLDDQIKSLSSSVANQIKGVDDQVKSVSSSVRNLASASDPGGSESIAGFCFRSKRSTDGSIRHSCTIGHNRVGNSGNSG